MNVFPILIKSFICMAVVSCNNHHTTSLNENYPFECEGKIEKTEITVYMYGSHTISCNNKKYALQSKNVDLDVYNGQMVKVKGSRIEGYPVDDGPEFIDVKVVEKN